MFCRNSLKLRITLSSCNAKSKSDRAKTQRSFVNSHESIVGESVWWAWLQPFARFIDLKLQIFGPSLVASSWIEEVFPSTPSTSPSRPTLGLEVYKFYYN